MSTDSPIDTPAAAPAVDEIADPQVAATKLSWWRREVAAAYQGAPTHPVMQALAPFA